MKKLTTLFILVFLAVGLFAEPKFPKYNFGDDDDVPYIYVSNDLQSVYELKAIVYPKSRKSSFSFIKKSLILPTAIHITIEFSNEKKLDDFIKDFDLLDIDNSFNNVRQKLIKEGITPDITLYHPDEKPRLITESKTVYGYGYEEHYNWKTIPSTIGYKATY